VRWFQFHRFGCGGTILSCGLLRVFRPSWMRAAGITAIRRKPLECLDSDSREGDEVPINFRLECLVPLLLRVAMKRPYQDFDSIDAQEQPAQSSLACSKRAAPPVEASVALARGRRHSGLGRNRCSPGVAGRSSAPVRRGLCIK
jgi:hypothetical protein